MFSNKGILMRKISFSQTLNQLTIFLKGMAVICLLYVINEYFWQKNTSFQNTSAVLWTMAILPIGGIIVSLMNRRSENQPLIDELYQTFEIDSIEAIKQLDKQLVEQLKLNKLFVSNKNQIVGTKDYLLLDFREGLFQLFPTKGLTKTQIAAKDSYYTLTLYYGELKKVIPFKKEQEAKELSKQLKKNYLKER